MFFYYCILLFIVCIVATAYLIPKIISVVQYKRLMDKPNQRSSHHIATPSLGGIAFYIVFVISLSFNNYYDDFHVSMSILPGITILFFLGLKDDLVVLSPKTKLLGQVVACMFVLINESFALNNLHGFLGIYEIPLWVGILGGLFLMLGIINSFNLIDGIDGLAASIAIVTLTFFTVIFGVLEFRFSFLSSLSMIGIMIGFLFFNLSKSKKIFMGDTGSLQVGFIIAVMTMRLMTANEGQLNQLPFDSSYNPIVLIALLIVPLYDAARVFTLRILKGKNPFSADRDHFHHLLIDAFKISHWKATFVIATFNIFFLGIILLILREFSIGAVCFVILFFLVLITIYSIKLKKRIISKLEKEENEVPKIKLFKQAPPSFHFEKQEPSTLNENVRF